jgi:hypothetical protein
VRLRAPVRRWRGVRDGVENEGEPRGYVMAAGAGGGRAGGSLDAVKGGDVPLTGSRAVGALAAAGSSSTGTVG